MRERLHFSKTKIVDGRFFEEGNRVIRKWGVSSKMATNSSKMMRFDDLSISLNFGEDRLENGSGPEVIQRHALRQILNATKNKRRSTDQQPGRTRDRDLTNEERINRLSIARSLHRHRRLSSEGGGYSSFILRTYCEFETKLHTKFVVDEVDRDWAAHDGSARQSGRGSERPRPENNRPNKRLSCVAIHEGFLDEDASNRRRE